ncbi:MAG: hypothetical protein U0L92_01470 [Clostridia bacterium]|nr:hypothetical protein [Clostridia bacterium]
MMEAFFTDTRQAIKQVVYNLKEYIVHTHAKDGIRLRENNLEIV